MPRSLDERLDADGYGLYVKGLNKTIRALADAGADAEDLKDLMHGIGEGVATEARTLTPYKTGRLQKSIRASRSKTSAMIRAGGARVPYAGVQHYGYPARNITATEYLTRPLQHQRVAIFNKLNDGLVDILQKNDLT